MSRLFLVEDADAFAVKLRSLREWHKEQARVHKMYASGKGLTPRYVQEELSVVAFHEAAVKTLYEFQVVDNA